VPAGSQVYQLTEAGTPPVTVEELKGYLKLPETDADDALLATILKAATEVAESYTRRSFRVSTWTLTLDEFCDRITLRRDPVTEITSITRLVAAVAVAVSAAVYYLKKGVQTSEVLLALDQDWPDDVDEREGAIVVTFKTGPHKRVASAKDAILRLAAYLYENRGDCGDLSAVGFGTTVSTDAIKASGAHVILDQLRVSRV
jgi:uncharacterized phiE125 gp8 family phage protein